MVGRATERKMLVRQIKFKNKEIARLWKKNKDLQNCLTTAKAMLQKMLEKEGRD